MNNSILLAALKSTTIDLSVLTDIINSHCQAETAMLMLLGVYTEPVLPVTSKVSNWSETPTRTIHLSKLISFNPLAEDRNQVLYTASYTATRFFKSAEKAQAYAATGEAYHSGDKSQEYCFDATFTVTQECTCSLSSWLSNK